MAQKTIQKATLKIAYPELTEEDKPLYSNAVAVNHTPWDFAIHFSQLVLPIRPPQGKGVSEIVGKQVAVINIPIPLVRGLISALETNLEIYEATHGKVEIPKERKGNNGRSAK